MASQTLPVRPARTMLARSPVILALLLASLLLIAGADAKRADGGCVIHYYSDLATKEPLVLHRATTRRSKRAVSDWLLGRRSAGWALPEGDEDHLTLSTGDEVLIACPGKRNNVTNLSSQPMSVVARCSGGLSADVEIAGAVYPVKDLSCAKSSQGDVLKKDTPCGPRNAILYELGFTVREEWYPMVSVCHVHERSNTLYTQHILQGESQDRRRRPIPRPSFDIGGDFYRGFSPNTAYRNANTSLLDLLGAGAPLFSSVSSKAIHRGHLSPDGDFLLTPYRLLTYFYVNTAPMWRVVNGGNWNLMENTIRKYAKYHSVDLVVATGVYQVLRLKDEHGNLKQFFLYSTYSRKQMPVPKHVWKVVYNPQTKEGIAFVILNDPFVEEVKEDDKLCTNICTSAKWLRRDDRWSVPSKGYLYCCAVDELRKTVTYLPEFDIKSILKGPY